MVSIRIWKSTNCHVAILNMQDIVSLQGRRMHQSQNKQTNGRTSHSFHFEYSAAFGNSVKGVIQSFQKSKHLFWLPDGAPCSEPDNLFKRDRNMEYVSSKVQHSVSMSSDAVHKLTSANMTVALGYRRSRVEMSAQKLVDSVANLQADQI